MFAKIPNSQCISVQWVVVVRPILLGARGTLPAQIPTGKLPIRSLSFFFFYPLVGPSRLSAWCAWDLACPVGTCPPVRFPCRCPPVCFVGNLPQAPSGKVPANSQLASKAWELAYPFAFHRVLY